jgi:fumarate hydratase class I
VAAPAPAPQAPAGIRLRTPLSEADVRKLKVGDMVLISGVMVTGRDAVHAHLMHHDAPLDLKGAVLYHCGPVAQKVAQEDGSETWRIGAAGPTTSIREEPYQADILRRFGIRVVIGKGGMGPKTLAALQECGAVYLNAVGGAAQYYARAIQRVRGVHLLEFGTPEAMWELEVKDFPAVVTMDSHGQSLHEHVAQASGAALHELEAPAKSLV